MIFVTDVLDLGGQRIHIDIRILGVAISTSSEACTCFTQRETMEACSSRDILLVDLSIHGHETYLLVLGAIASTLL